MVTSNACNSSAENAPAGLRSADIKNHTNPKSYKVKLSYL